MAAWPAASLTNLSSYDRLPSRHRQDDTIAVVRLTANLFVVMTSLVPGLMINSAKNTFESIDHNVHAYATELILFDRSLRQYGPETQDARQPLIAYVQRVVDATSVSQKTPAVANKLSELLLNETGNRLAQLAPPTIMLIRPDGSMALIADIGGYAAGRAYFGDLVGATHRAPAEGATAAPGA